MRQWLRIGQAARLLSVSQTTLRRWERKGYLRASRTPTGYRRYELADLYALMGRRDELGLRAGAVRLGR